MKLKEYIFEVISSDDISFHIHIYATNKDEAEYIICQYVDIRDLKSHKLVKTKYKSAMLNYLIDKYNRAEDVVKAQYNALDSMRAMYGK